MEHKVVAPCESLDGWHWVDYNDGSGYLESPKGEKFFGYEIHPCYPYYIEYQIYGDSDYNAICLTLKKFKEYAEKKIMEMLNNN